MRRARLDDRCRSRCAGCCRFGRRRAALARLRIVRHVRSAEDRGEQFVRAVAALGRLPMRSMPRALSTARDTTCANTPASLVHLRPARHAALAAVAALVGIGLVMIFTASSATAYSEHHDTAFYASGKSFGSSSAWAPPTSRTASIITSSRTAAPYILLASMISLDAGARPACGHLGQRCAALARRLASVSFQPSEFAKLALVIYLGAMLCDARRTHHVVRARTVSRSACPSSSWRCSILKEPDMGTASLLAMTAFAMFFAAGARDRASRRDLRRNRSGARILGSSASPYKRARIFAFVDPWRIRRTPAFTSCSRCLALGSGGLFGVGLGASRAKFFYLPEAIHRFHFLRAR